MKLSFDGHSFEQALSDLQALRRARFHRSLQNQTMNSFKVSVLLVLCVGLLPLFPFNWL